MPLLPVPSRLERSLLLPCFIFFVLALVACGPTTAVNTPVPTTAIPEQPPATSVPTVQPSPTIPSPQVLLLVPEGADAQVSSALQTLLADLSAEAGWLFDVQPSLSPADLPDALKVVVVLPPDPGLAELTAAAPQAQFLAVGIPGAEPGPNLSVIGAQGRSLDGSAFLAGYLAAAVTPDWRAGVVAGSDTEGKSSQLAFTNGVYYFCGLCRPAFPPFPQPGYPLVAELPEGAGQADWQNAAAYFQTWGVQTVYVDPGAGNVELLEYLAGEGFNLIGTGPRPEGVRDRWVATITSGDLLQAVRQVWPDLASGKGENNTELALTVTEINEDLFSPGRQRLVEEMVADLAGGFIDTGVDAESGENLE